MCKTARNISCRNERLYIHILHSVRSRCEPPGDIMFTSDPHRSSYLILAHFSRQHFFWKSHIMRICFNPLAAKLTERNPLTSCMGRHVFFYEVVNSSFLTNVKMSSLVSGGYHLSSAPCDRQSLWPCAAA